MRPAINTMPYTDGAPSHAAFCPPTQCSPPHAGLRPSCTAQTGRLDTAIQCDMQVQHSVGQLGRLADACNVRLHAACRLEKAGKLPATQRTLWQRAMQQSMLKTA